MALTQSVLYQKVPDQNKIRFSQQTRPVFNLLLFTNLGAGADDGAAAIDEDLFDDEDLDELEEDLNNLEV